MHVVTISSMKSFYLIQQLLLQSVQCLFHITKLYLHITSYIAAIRLEKASYQLIIISSIASYSQLHRLPSIVDEEV